MCDAVMDSLGEDKPYSGDMKRGDCVVLAVSYGRKSYWIAVMGKRGTEVSPWSLDQ